MTGLFFRFTLDLEHLRDAVGTLQSGE